MDAFLPYQPGRAAASAPMRVLRGLKVRDFDAPPAAADAGLAELEAAERSAMLNAARAEGQAAGVAEGQRQAAETQSAQQAAALQAVAVAMQQATTAAATAVEHASDALARLVLAALDTALPAASARLAADTAALLARTLRPVLEECGALHLSVAAGLGEACVAALDDARIVVTEDASLAPGDARAEWRGGEAAMELARQREMVAEVLHALGLQGQ
jgi:flagellar biosynthesis/type III secretory pathway protein FliH